MRNNRLKSQDPIESRPSAKQEIDYSAKIYTSRERIVFVAKLVAGFGIFFLMLWLFEKHLAV